MLQMWTSERKTNMVQGVFLMKCPNCKTQMIPIYDDCKTFVNNTHTCPNCKGFMNEATYVKMWGFK